MNRSIIRSLIRWSATRLRRRHVWLRRPPPLGAQRVCLLASFSADGFVSEHTLHLASHWRHHGFTVILIVASDRRPRVRWDAAQMPDIDGLLWRRNTGYDFGSWADTMQARPDVLDASLLALTNDSLYGPLQGFGELLARVDAAPGDVIAMTDSHEVRHHFQSYLVFYRPSALLSSVFVHFWTSFAGGGREAVIEQAEIPQMSTLQAGGLRVDILFPAATEEPVNPSLLHWRALVGAGFPFVKVDLLRSNPWRADIGDWDRVLAQHGFDPGRVRRHLGRRFVGSSAEAACSAEFKANTG